MSTTEPAPTPTPAPAPAKKPIYKRVWFWLVIVAVVILLAFAGCAAVVVNAVGDAAPQELSASAPATPGEPEPSSDADDNSAAEPETSPEPSAADEVGSQANPAPYGSPLTLGDWTVTVNTVNAETANAEIAEENEFNEAATEGQYVLVNITALYNGEGEGNAWLDLDARLIGTDNVLYDTGSAVFPDDLTSQPSVLAGGTVSGNLLIDADPAALGEKNIAITAGLISSEVGVWSAAAQ